MGHAEAIAVKPSAIREYGPRLTVVGALRIVRMVPVLELAELPLLDEVKTIATTRSQAPNAAVAEEIVKLKSWVLLDHHDFMPSVIDVYYKAFGLALAVAGAFPRPAVRARRAASPGPVPRPRGRGR